MSTRGVGERRERHRGDDLELAHRRAALVLGLEHRPSERTARSRGRSRRGRSAGLIGWFVDGDPLDGGLQVRAGGPAGALPVSARASIIGRPTSCRWCRRCGCTVKVAAGPQHLHQLFRSWWCWAPSWSPASAGRADARPAAAMRRPRRRGSGRVMPGRPAVRIRSTSSRPAVFRGSSRRRRRAPCQNAFVVEFAAVPAQFNFCRRPDPSQPPPLGLDVDGSRGVGSTPTVPPDNRTSTCGWREVGPGLVQPGQRRDHRRAFSPARR